MDLLYGEGDLFQREIRRESEAKMRQSIADLHAPDIDIQCETILGEAFVGVTHAVQQEGYDLVLAGTRGHSAWQQILIGSTARRLIRKCPADVWITRAEHAEPPRTVLALTDFSDVGRKAALHACWVANQAGASLHVLHVIDSGDVPDDLISKIPAGGSLRQEISDEARRHLDVFVASLGIGASDVQAHLSWGTPWKEITRTAEHLSADLMVLGTVGRSGIPGMLLGNTAERVLGHCDCSLLTVKPDGFISPISPAAWSLPV
jgi:nucleotide-binding universal stress UspA family protein